MTIGKFTILTAICIATAFTFLACDGENNVTETGNVLHVRDSIQTGEARSYSFDAKILVFDSITDIPLLKSIYAPTEINADKYSKKGLKKALLEMKERYISNNKKSNGYYNFKMEISSKTDKFLTINYVSEGFLEGASGGSVIKTKVFDLENKRLASLNSIIKNPADKAWDRILRDNFLVQNKEIAEKCIPEEIMPTNDNFYFDSTGIAFDYNYDYCGEFSIKIPYDKRTEKLLTPSFAKLASQNPSICEVPYSKISLKPAIVKKGLSLTLAFCDENMESGYAIYDGKTERMLIQLAGKGTYNEMHQGEINGQYVLSMQEETLTGAYHILKKGNKRTDFKIPLKMLERIVYASDDYQKFEYDNENRIQKALHYSNGELTTSIYTYNSDGSLKIESQYDEGCESTNYSITGNTITKVRSTIMQDYVETSIIDEDGDNDGNDGKKSPFYNCKTPKWYMQEAFGLWLGNKAENSIYEYDSEGFPVKLMSGKKVVATFAYSSEVKAVAKEAAGNTFIDSRDCNKEYKFVKIGSQTWMAENLNYNTGNSWCYGNDKSNCRKYGRLYNWETAKVACPNEWHLPDSAEWDQLIKAVGGGKTAATKLKSKSGWARNGNGTDNYGFSAKPGGYRVGTGVRGSARFDDDGFQGHWWSASEKDDVHAHQWYMYDHYGSASWGPISKDIWYSVRCVKD
jgi:uncharacterized protein (TIGR02145 family)